jgi:hypothetical protein
MKAKLLSFAFIYFSELGHFNALRRIKIKNLLPLSPAWRSEARALSSFQWSGGRFFLQFRRQEIL